MLILSFDSTDYTSVTLSEDTKIISSKNVYKKRLSEQLILMIQEVLSKAKIEFSDIDYLAITNGPGSFTGIRVGLSVAKGIVAAMPQIKIAVFSNFEVINYYILKQIKHCAYSVIIIKTFDTNVYLQIFKQFKPLGDAKIFDVLQASNIISALEGNIICGGDGLLLLYNLLEQYKNITLLPRASYVQARTLAKLAHQQIKNNDYSNKIVPLYITPPSTSCMQV